MSWNSSANVAHIIETSNSEITIEWKTKTTATRKVDLDLLWHQFSMFVYLWFARKPFDSVSVSLPFSRSVTLFFCLSGSIVVRLFRWNKDNKYKIMWRQFNSIVYVLILCSFAMNWVPHQHHKINACANRAMLVYLKFVILFFILHHL